MKGEVFTGTYRQVVTILFAIVITLHLGSLSVYAKEVRGVTDNLVKLAVSADLTGPAATESLMMTSGFKTYFRYINDQGGINGRKVEVRVEDDHYSIPVSIAGFKKLIFKDKVMAIFGPSSTGAAVALFAIINKAKMPTFVWSPSDKLTRSFSRYVFGHQASYRDQTEIIFDYIMNDLKPSSPKIAYIGPDNEYGKDGLETSRKRAGFYGIKLVDEEVLSPGTIDATTQAIGLKKSKADYVVTTGYVSTVVPLMRSARKFGYSPNFFVDWVTCIEDTVKIAGGAAKNLYGVHNYGSWYEQSPGMEQKKKIFSKYYPEIKRIHRSNVSSCGWVTGMVMSEGIRRAGRNLNNESFIDALETLRDFDTGGICGKVTYTSKSHKAGRYARVYKADIEKKRFVPITDWRKPIEKR